MIWMFLCGVARVAFVTAYTVLVFADIETARGLVTPFAIVVLAVAVYDAHDRRRRQKCCGHRAA